MIVEFETSSQEVAHAIGAIHFGNNQPILAITTDSRLLHTHCLFVPLVGQKFDAHDFIEDVCKTGKCSAYLTHKKDVIENTQNYNVSALLCNDTLQAYAAIARWHRKKFSIPVVGITGTNGKTTTKEIIAHILSLQGKCLKTEKNYNNEIGVPFTILHCNASHKYAVIEMGMNHQGEIARLSAIAMPTIAVITNIGEGHLEFLGSTQNVALAKSEIFEGMHQGALCILNNDTIHTDIIKKKAGERNIHIITYGLSGDIKPASYTLFPDKTVVEYQSMEFTVHAYGLHNVYAIMAAIAVGKVLEITLLKIKEALLSFTPVSMRSSILQGRCTIIDDSYNANPLSVDYALTSAATVFQDTRKIAVLSDMKELGDASEDLHYRVGTKVAHAGFEQLFVYGDYAHYLAEGAIAAGLHKTNVKVFSTKEELIADLLRCIQSDDVVLVKGSRSMKMEDVVHALL